MSLEFRKEATAAYVAIGRVQEADESGYADDQFMPTYHSARAALTTAGLSRKRQADNEAYLLLDAELANVYEHHSLFMLSQSASPQLFNPDYYVAVGNREYQCGQEVMEYFDARREILRDGKPVALGPCLKSLLAGESAVPKGRIAK